MLYAGLDLSRKRLDFHLLDSDGATVEVGAAPPDADGLLGLTRRLDRHREPIRAAIESMNGARFVHDRLELAGWQVEIADAQKVKGLAPLACKTDRIDAWVLAELARRDLVRERPKLCVRGLAVSCESFLEVGVEGGEAFVPAGHWAFPGALLVSDREVDELTGGLVVGEVAADPDRFADDAVEALDLVGRVDGAT